MTVTANPTHGSKNWINSESFLDDLHVNQKGRQILYNKGLELVKKYPFLGKLSHREIKAESCDLNYTIQSTNAFLMGVYNPFNRMEKLPFNINDPKIFPPEPLSFDPAKLANFDTALPYGARFIPVFSSSGHHDLKFMLADETCPLWKKKSKEALFYVNDRLKKSIVFNENLKKVETYLNINDELIFTQESNRSLIEKCYRLKLRYNDVTDSEYEVK
jgi:hypothetical protein